MKIVFTFDGNDEKVVGMYWQDGQDVKGEVHDERGNFTKTHKKTSLKDLAKHLVHAYVDGYVVDLHDIKIAKAYLGKSPDIIKKVPKSTL
jgi:hypothetical protein